MIRAALILAALGWANPAAADTVAERFEVPAGCSEVAAPPGGFAAWLAARPLAPKGTPVRASDGSRVWATYSPALAVLDLDLLGPQDCADSVMRLRGEYLWSAGKVADLSMKYLSGDAIPWSRWAEGCRPELDAAHRRVGRWVCSGTRSDGYADFEAYLENVMRYANSASLARDLDTIAADALGPGDVIAQPNPTGGVGHAAIVLRTVTCEDGETRHLVANGFLPPQSVHVIGKRKLLGAQPWLTLDEYREQMRPLGEPFAYRRFPQASNHSPR